MRLACATVFCLALCLPAAAQQPELVSSADARTPEQERQAFHLPPGFEAELVACEPEINKPMNIAFDDRGRLWVTSTVEYPFPAKEGAKTRDAVKILDQFGPDGRARRVTTFADNLNIPIGVIPIGGGDQALVHSIPKIWRLTDTDGDGKADKRETAYSEYGFGDTHGMTSAFTWGFDGWIYACHGYSNTSTVKGSAGSSITMNSGNVYRVKPDGSRIEYFTHGQVNPFGLSFDPLGNLYSADCHSRPVYQLLRGAYYPSFGKPDDGLGFGPEMVSHDHGSTAISGVVYYAAEQFPASWRGTVFIGNVVTNRINHDQVEWHGSTPRGVLSPDFLVSDDPWFRPVDLELGPDGALYVADFYNRIIGHYEVPLTHPGRDRERGRIWRIVYRGPEPHAEPKPPRDDWTKATVDTLIEDLGHANLAVRTKAANQLAERKDKDLGGKLQAALKANDNAYRRLHVLWVMYRRGELGRQAILACAGDRDPAVRTHAMRVIGERPSLPGPESGALFGGLRDSDAHVRQAAAEGLGRHPATDNVRPLLDLLRSVPDDDAQLRHAARIALRNQLLQDTAWKHLPRTRSEADDHALADVAPGVHSAEAARFLLDYIPHAKEPNGALEHYVHHVARYGGEGTADELLEFVQRDQPNDLGHQAAMLRAIVRGTQERGSALANAQRGWAEAICRTLLESPNGGEVQTGLDLAGMLKLEPLSEAVEALATNKQKPQAQRTAATNAIVSFDPARATQILGRVLADASEPMGVREAAAGSLAKLNRPEAHKALVAALATAPSRLQGTIAGGLSGSGREGAEALLEAVASGKASARLLQSVGVQIRLKNSGTPGVNERLEKLTAGLPPADQKQLEQIQKQSASFAKSHADAALGAQVFEKTCASCHILGGKGGKVGPQLDGVGLRGVDRLLEDVLDPNRNVDLQFRATTLALANGQVLTGLLLREEGEVLVLADAQGKEQRIAKGDVEDRKITPLSPMPANLSEQLSEADLNNLVAYLLTQQPPRDAGR